MVTLYFGVVNNYRVKITIAGYILVMAYYAGKYGVPYRDAYEFVKSNHTQTVYHWDWIDILPAAKTWGGNYPITTIEFMGSYAYLCIFSTACTISCKRSP
jgi:hypothetical protein